jgi:hypothetical protein
VAKLEVAAMGLESGEWGDGIDSFGSAAGVDEQPSDAKTGGAVCTAGVVYK